MPEQPGPVEENSVGVNTGRGQEQETNTGAGPVDATSGAEMGFVQTQGGIDEGLAATDTDHKTAGTSGHGTATQNTLNEEDPTADKSNCCCKMKMGIWFAIAGTIFGTIGIAFPVLEWWIRGRDTSWLTLIFVMIYLGAAFFLFYLAKAIVYDRRQRESLMLEKAIEAAEKTDDTETKKLVYRQIALSIMGIEE